MIRNTNMAPTGGLTLRQLRAVLAVRNHGKIVNAAKALGLSQPAVTLQLQEAEGHLGIPLFERLPGGMRPTAAGTKVVEAALAIEDRLRVLGNEVEALKGGQQGLLRLGVVSTAKYFAPAIMAAFKRAHPEIDMTIWVGNREETIDSITAHNVDVALMGRPPRGLPIRASVFGEHPSVIIAPVDHPLVKERNISKLRIAEEQFLMREPGSGTRIALEIFFSDVPGRSDYLGIEMGSNETIKQAVMAGLGIALISAHTIAQEVEIGRLAVLDVEGMPVKSHWFCVSRSDRLLTPVMETFEAFLRREGEGFLPKVTGA